jgi:hypothetical protein
MKSLLYHAFGVKGFRYLRTRYEGGEIIFEVEPEKEPEVPAGQKLRRHGYRWRTVDGFLGRTLDPCLDDYCAVRPSGSSR